MSFFQATPIAGQTVPVWSSAEKTAPDWYNQTAAQVVANQKALMDRPFDLFGGPRVAGFTGDQTSGFDMTRGAAGSFQPGLSAAFGAAQTGLGGSAMGAAQPYMDQANQSIGQNTAAYMDPYISNVVNRIGDLGMRQLNERVLPGINDQFIQSGQFGSSRNAEAFGRGVRDAMDGIIAAQGQALSTGFGQAGQFAATDLARRAGLAQTAGGLAGQDINNQFQGGALMANLGAQQQQLGLTGAGALSQIGAQQQGLNQKNLDLAVSDFERQRNWPQENLNATTQTLAALAPSMPQATNSAGVQPLGQQQFAPSGLQQVGGVLTGLAGLGGALGLFGGG